MEPSAIFNKAFDILVEHAGATDGDWQRTGFVDLFTTSTTAREWRFQGLLGFGGKFWRHSDGRLTVSYYREDKTTERDAIVTRVNELLSALTHPDGFAPKNLAQPSDPK